MKFGRTYKIVVPEGHSDGVHVVIESKKLGDGLTMTTHIYKAVTDRYCCACEVNLLVSQGDPELFEELSKLLRDTAEACQALRAGKKWEYRLKRHGYGRTG